jgi:endo-1,4-beta-D-glucanase Y
LLETDEAAARKILHRAYESWRRLYVTGEGARGALRIRRPEDHDDTVSEGVAYGMLIAVYHGDQALFDGLFEYAKARFDGNGLMHWKINSEGRVAGAGAASDADEDMAIALIMADKLWGKPYDQFAKRMIASIYEFEIEPGTLVMKPGDVWGGSLVTNPSYFDPAYFKIFAEYTGDKRWLAVVDKTYRMLESVSSHNGGTGLVPDWMTAGAGPAKGQSYDYKWDATRAPLRIARDAAWFCDARALKVLAPINEFFQKQGPLSIGDGYKLDGTKFSSVHSAAFVGPVAASSLFSEDAAFRATLWKDLVKLWGGGYYSNHLRHLSLLFVTGLFPNPLEFKPKAAVENAPRALPDHSAPMDVAQPPSPTNATDVAQPPSPTNATDVAQPSSPTNATDVAQPSSPSHMTPPVATSPASGNAADTSGTPSTSNHHDGTSPSTGSHGAPP